MMTMMITVTITMMMTTVPVIMMTVVEIMTTARLTTLMKMMFKLRPTCRNALEVQNKRYYKIKGTHNHVSLFWNVSQSVSYGSIVRNSAIRSQNPAFIIIA